MVLAIIEARKTQTRRPFSSQPPEGTEHLIGPELYEPGIIRNEELVPGPAIFGVYDEWDEWGERCPYGGPGDHLYVRETWRVHSTAHSEPIDRIDVSVWYRADSTLRRFSKMKLSEIPAHKVIPDSPGHWRPSIHMPKWAARIRIPVKSLRAQRVLDISEEDAIAEGVEPLFSYKEIHEPHYRAELDHDPMPYKNYLWHGYIGHGITVKQVDAWPYQYSSYQSARDSFLSLWERLYAKRELGLAANPWVWVVETPCFDPEQHFCGEKL